MKLKECLEIGKECGLTTLNEALMNIEIHATNVFSYSEMSNELNELYESVKDISGGSLIEDLLNDIK